MGISQAAHRARQPCRFTAAVGLGMKMAWPTGSHLRLDRLHHPRASGHESAYRSSGVPFDRGSRDVVLAYDTDTSCAFNEVSTSDYGNQWSYEAHGKNFTTLFIGNRGELLNDSITHCANSTPADCKCDFA